MKPLTVIFLAAISIFVPLAADAQSVAEAARQERARQAQTPDTKNVYTNETTKDLEPIMPVVTKPTDPSTAKPGATPAPAVSTIASPEAKQADLLKEYNEQLQALKTKLQGLQDQETAVQLQINEYNNQFFAPVTNATAQLEAQNKLNETKTQLAQTRSELIETRSALQKLEAQGPPAAPAPVPAKK